MAMSSAKRNDSKQVSPLDRIMRSSDLNPLSFSILCTSLGALTGIQPMSTSIAKTSSANGQSITLPVLWTSVHLALFRFKRTGKRNEIFLVTKFGFNMEPWPGGKTTIGDPDYVFKAVEKSLSRLGVDCLDLSTTCTGIYTPYSPCRHPH